MKKKIVIISFICISLYFLLPELTSHYLKEANTEYAPLFIYSNFYKIKPGMTKKEVETLIGKPFAENSLMLEVDNEGPIKNKPYEGQYTAYYSHLNNQSWVSKFFGASEINAYNVRVQYTKENIVDSTHVSGFNW